MEINRQALLQNLQNSIVGAEKGEFLNNAFSFRDGYVHTFKDFVALSIFLGDEFKFLRGSIRAVEFFSLLSKYTTETVDIEVKPTSIDVRSGRSHASFVIVEDAVLKQLDKMDMAALTWVPVAEDFREALNFCLLGVREYNLEGVRVKGKMALSVDNKRINFFEMKSEMGDFLVEEKVVTELLKFQDYVSFASTLSRIFLKLRDGTIISGRKRMDVDYPLDNILGKLAKLSPAEGDPKGVLPSAFKQMIGRASVLSTQWTGMNVIKMSFTPDYIQCEAERTIGRYEEKIEWEEKPVGLTQPIQVFLESVTTLYALEKSKEFYIKSEKESPRLIFVGPNCKCMLAAYLGEKKAEKKK